MVAQLEQWRKERVHPKRRPYDTVAGLKGKIGAVVRFVTAKKSDKEQIREGVVRMAPRFGIARKTLSKCVRTCEDEDGPGLPPAKKAKKVADMGTGNGSTSARAARRKRREQQKSNAGRNNRKTLSKCVRTGEEEDGPAAAAQRAADDPNEAAGRKAR